MMCLTTSFCFHQVYLIVDLLEYSHHALACFHDARVLPTGNAEAEVVAWYQSRDHNAKKATDSSP